MTVDIKALGIDQMSVEDRLQLISEIWRSIPSPVLTPEQEEELDRRLDWIEVGEATFMTLEEVRGLVKRG